MVRTRARMLVIRSEVSGEPPAGPPVSVEEKQCGLLEITRVCCKGRSPLDSRRPPELKVALLPAAARAAIEPRARLRREAAVAVPDVLEVSRATGAGIPRAQTTVGPELLVCYDNCPLAIGIVRAPCAVETTRTTGRGALTQLFQNRGPRLRSSFCFRGAASRRRGL